MNGSGANAPLPEVQHLVFHQSDEGGDDNAHTVLGKGRHLKCDGFATARRHQSESVVTSTNGHDDFLLNASETIISPVLL